ncbi:MAG TPA: hypothetical protein VF345_11655 [Chthoniobacterales bacterium]
MITKLPTVKTTPAPTPPPTTLHTPPPVSTPIKIPGKITPTPGPTFISGTTLHTPPPVATPIKIPGNTPAPTPKKILIPGNTPNPTPTVGPIKIPGNTPAPTPKKNLIPGNTPNPTPTVGPIKIPGSTPTPTPKKNLIPGKTSPTPTPQNQDKDSKGKDKDSKGKDKDSTGKDKDSTGRDKDSTGRDKDSTGRDKDSTGRDRDSTGRDRDSTGRDRDSKWKRNDNVRVWINIDVYPPPPSELGPPIIITEMPVYDEVPQSETNEVDEGYAPVPDNYAPPPQNAPAEISSTALRAWNGQEDPASRAFDQTRVKVPAADDGSVSWQFYWKTTGPEAQAARWEVATVPFVAGFTDFPPAGLVGYGDASINAESPLTENFFAVDFNSFSKNFEEGARPNKYYMRVVPVDLDGNLVGTASNFVRIDLP